MPTNLPLGDEWTEIGGRPQMWDPDSGAEIVGTYQETRHVHIGEKDGSTREGRIYLLETAGGMGGVWGSGLLDYLVDIAEPPLGVGDTIRITYEGMKDIGSGRAARQYRLARRS